MKHLITLGCVALTLAFASPPAMAVIVGSWDWTGADPYENDANPGTYDAVPVTQGTGTATASGGTASFTGAFGNVNDGHFDIGNITQLQGADNFEWIFEDAVGPNAGGSMVLAGSSSTPDPSRSLFRILAVPSNGSDEMVGVKLWDAAGNGVGFVYWSPSDGIYQPVINTAFDLKVIFDGANERVGVITRVGTATTWGAPVWKAFAGASTLNSDVQYDVLLGKYEANNVFFGPFTVGKVTLDVIPEPASMLLLAVGGLMVSARGRRGH